MSTLSLKESYHRLISLAEKCDGMATRHDHGTTFLPPKISSAALRDFACHVENAIKAISPAALQAIEPLLIVKPIGTSALPPNADSQPWLRKHR
jgi:hypothetical protein